jgi:hypothetical protein
MRFFWLAIIKYTFSFILNSLLVNKILKKQTFGPFQPKAMAFVRGLKQ